MKKSTVLDARPTGPLPRRPQQPSPVEVKNSSQVEKKNARGSWRKLSPLGRQQEEQGGLIHSQSQSLDTSFAPNTNTTLGSTDVNLNSGVRDRPSPRHSIMHRRETRPLLPSNPTDSGVYASEDCGSSSAGFPRFSSMGNIDKSRDNGQLPDGLCTGGSEVTHSSAVHGEAITDELLRRLTRCSDLKAVSSAQFQLDFGTLRCVESISARMPQLNSLKLNNSRITELRVLGTNYANLRRLWISNCLVSSVSGVGACAPVLEELYASFNSISDIGALTEVSSTLQVVDLEGNDIRDTDMLKRTLPQLKKMKHLVLKGNPVASSETIVELSHSSEEKGTRQRKISYSKLIGHLMPDLQYLDDAEISNTSLQKSARVQKKHHSAHVDPLEICIRDEYLFVQECIRECGFDALGASGADEMHGSYSRLNVSLISSRSHQLKQNKPSYDRNRPSVAVRSLRKNSQSTASSGDSTNQGCDGGKPRPSCQRWGPTQRTSRLFTGRVTSVGAPKARCRQLPPLKETPASPSTEGLGNEPGNDGQRQQESGAMMQLALKPVPPDANSTRGERKQQNTTSPICGLTAAKGNVYAFDVCDDDDDELEKSKESLMHRVRLGNSATSQQATFMGSGTAKSTNSELADSGLSFLLHRLSTCTHPSGADPPDQRNEQQQEQPTTAGATSRCLDDLETPGDGPLESLNGTPEKDWEWRRELMQSVVDIRKMTSEAALKERVQGSKEVDGGGLEKVESEDEEDVSPVVF